MQSTIGISALEHGTKQPIKMDKIFRHTDMSKENTNSHLSDVCTLSAHVWPCYDLKISLVPNHPAVVIDACCGILDMNEWMFALYKVDLLLLFWANQRFHILMS